MRRTCYEKKFQGNGEKKAVDSAMTNEEGKTNERLHGQN